MRSLIAALALITIAAEAPDFAPRPITDAEKEVIRQAVKKKLIDPASAQFRWNAQLRDPVVYCGFVNSKNRMGGYSGFSIFEVLLDTRDTTVMVVNLGGDKSIAAEAAQVMCQRTGYNLNPGDLNTIDD